MNGDKKELFYLRSSGFTCGSLLSVTGREPGKTKTGMATDEHG
jgi:hypothetical protein